MKKHVASTSKRERTGRFIAGADGALFISTWGMTTRNRRRQWIEITCCQLLKVCLRVCFRKLRGRTLSITMVVQVEHKQPKNYLVTIVARSLYMSDEVIQIPTITFRVQRQGRKIPVGRERQSLIAMLVFFS